MLRYDLGTGENKNWLVSETAFHPQQLGKCEAIMSLGNGYMGIRATMEEPYYRQTRNMFVAGTFNQFADNEVTELPNAADLIEMNILLNDDYFSLEKGKIIAYRRDLNVRTGELVRRVEWENEAGEQYRFVFRRFVSMHNLHLLAAKVDIEPLNSTVHLKLSSGINAQMTNSGTQHFREGEKRIFDKTFIQLLQQTTESNIDFVLNTTHRLAIDGTPVAIQPEMAIGRRQVSVAYDVTLEKGQTLSIEKISNVFTSRDKAYDNEQYNLQTLRDAALANLKEEAAKGYARLFAESVAAWQAKWDEMAITIDSEQSYDQLALRFAQYHLLAMTPSHDNRFNIGAKGLSGEGYKGHAFWDTEIFILPFFIYTFPEVARQLLEYRYNTLPGARRKARGNGYRGAMYAWESAFTGDETTPVWGAVDIVTGKATKIWSGFIEQHITSDVAYAVWQYYSITGDQSFMDAYGYEILFDTATFWASRLEWNEAQQQYHINDVIGPDEYKEHVNNNAFTNYMAHWNIDTALRCSRELREARPELWASLNDKLDLTEAEREWSEKLTLIYLPQPREADLVIPQDDTYLTKKVIDLSKYKNQEQVGSLFKDYNLEQVNEMQVSKQADIMILFYLLEHKFSPDVKRANWEYYEPKTLHDSSLSLSTHSVLASDMDDPELAYSLFSRAARIDLGPNMHSSDHGIHAASIGGMWQCVVNGFGGVRLFDGKLRLNPKLPRQWSRLTFPLYWQGERLVVAIDKTTLQIERVTNGEAASSREVISLEVAGNTYELERQLRIDLKGD